MKGNTNFIHIILALLIALIMLTLMAGMAFGIVWFLKTYMGDDLDPSNNIITECIGKCQDEQICSVGTSSNYRLVNGECQCSCIKIKNSNVSDSTNVQSDDWQLYESPDFSIQYPDGWDVRDDVVLSESALETHSFSSPEIVGDYIWSVFSFDGNLYGIDTLVADVGAQYADRKETRERIVISGEQAIKVTVTTDAVPGWEQVQVYLEKGEILYLIDDGSSRNEEFEKFYNSFQFTE